MKAQRRNVSFEKRGRPASLLVSVLTIHPAGPGPWMPLSREGACDAPSWQQRAPAPDKLGPERPSGAGQVARLPQLHGWRSVPWGPAPGGRARAMVRAGCVRQRCHGGRFHGFPGRCGRDAALAGTGFGTLPYRLQRLLSQTRHAEVHSVPARQFTWKVGRMYS